MYKITKTLLTTGIVLAIQPITVIPTRAEIVKPRISQTPNLMMELAENWGFELTECGKDVVIIQHDSTGEKACIVPNEQLGAGNFIYDSANNKIQPETIQTTINNRETKTEQIGETETEQIGETGIIFNFANAYDYNVCLDNILLAYEDRQTELAQSTKNECANNILSEFGNQLSENTALELITAADNYATEDLEIQLYPTFGLRRRVAMHFGYLYDIDENNEDILQYISSER